jgi:hypothetical protein
MTIISRSITIDAKRADVFRKIADGNASAIYNSAILVKDLEAPGDDHGALGTRWNWDYELFGLSLHGTTEVKGRMQDEKWVTQTRGDANTEWEYTFADDGPGTRLTISIDIDDAVMSRFSLAKDLFIRNTTSQLERVLNNCKAWLED